MVTQLYTKDIDGNYNKVNWNRLKVTPNYKIKEAMLDIIEKKRQKEEFVDGYKALSELRQILHLEDELDLRGD